MTPLRRATVVGEVNRPGTYYMETRATVREAIALAGEMNPIAVIGHVNILRDSARLRIDDWQRRGDDAVILRSGDVLSIDRQPWIEQNLFSVISGVGVLFSVLYTALHR